jgi:hypothetical protein
MNISHNKIFFQCDLENDNNRPQQLKTQFEISNIGVPLHKQ